MSGEWRTLYNTGHVASQARLSRVRGGKKVADFLDRVVEEFAKGSRKYCELVGELPFIYRERQTNSVLLPAIARIADAALTETPVARHHQDRSRSGWVDFWAAYEDIDLYIEVKHSWQAVSSGDIRQKTATAWNALGGQLASLPANLSEYTQSSQTLKVALLVVPCYQSSNDKDKLHVLSRDGTAGVWHLIRESLPEPAPNWSCLWHLSTELQGPLAYEDRYERYPCVVFAVYVEAAG